MRVRWLRSASIVALLGVAVACGEAWREELAPVPFPELSGTEAASRERLEAQRGELEALLEDPRASRAELAGAFGRSGQLYHAYGLLDVALPCYRNAAQLAPEEFRWHYLSAFVAQSTGDVPAAATTLERALELRSGDLSALSRLGEIRLEEGRADLAAALFERLLNTPGGIFLAHFGLGRSALAAGDLRGAVEHFEAALALEPEAERLPYLLAQAHRRLNNLKEAEAYLGRPAGRPIGAPEPLLAEVDAMGVQGIFKHIRTGDAARRQGNLRAAIEAYSRAVEEDPGSVPARHSLGSTLAEAGDLGGALEQYRSAVAAEPETPALRQNLAALLLRTGAVEEALAAYRQAASLDPRSKAIGLGLARALRAAGRHAEAVGELERILGHDPEDAEIQVSRAHALHLAGRGEAAAEELERVLEGAPEGPRRRVLQIGLAELLGERGESERARQLYRELTTGAPEASVKSQAYLALAELAKPDAKLALRHLRQAVMTHPGDPAARFALAGALAGAGRYAESLEHFRATIELRPGHVQARVLEGAALVLLERYAEAKARLERGLEEIPGSGDIGHSLARLLATCPDDTIRNGELALGLAESLFSAGQSVDLAETLAMALAETGRFADAIQWQERLIAEAEKSEQHGVLPRLRRNLERYRQGEPCRAPWLES